MIIAYMFLFMITTNIASKQTYLIRFKIYDAFVLTGFSLKKGETIVYGSQRCIITNLLYFSPIVLCTVELRYTFIFYYALSLLAIVYIKRSNHEWWSIIIARIGYVICCLFEWSIYMFEWLIFYWYLNDHSLLMS